MLVGSRNEEESMRYAVSLILKHLNQNYLRHSFPLSRDLLPGTCMLSISIAFHVICYSTPRTVAKGVATPPAFTRFHVNEQHDESTHAPGPGGRPGFGEEDFHRLRSSSYKQRKWASEAANLVARQ
jgi:hypothetical protein